MSHAYKTRAIVIRRKNIGEADRLIDVYTPTLGRLRLKAKGVRKIRSKLAGHLELLAVVECYVVEGRRSDIITSARQEEVFPDLGANLQKTSLAFYICELVFYLTEEGHRDTRLYRLLEWSLQTLNDSPAREKKYWPLFLSNVELQMLAYLGFRPELSKCARCGKKLTVKNNKFSSAHGGVVCQNCTASGAIPISVEVIKILRLLLERQIRPAQWAGLPPPAAVTLRRVLKDFIRYTLERQLRAEKFLELVERQEMRAGNEGS